MSTGLRDWAQGFLSNSHSMCKLPEPSLARQINTNGRRRYDLVPLA